MNRFRAELVRNAIEELARYGNLTARESPLKERIAAYWHFLDPNGPPFHAWSAAFISFMAHLAGAGDAFRYSCRHSEYVHRAINARLAGRKNAPFVGYRAGEVRIGPGDIVGMNRSDAPHIQYKWAAENDRYKSHCDIVVSVTPDAITTIGGNVGPAPGAVGTKTWIRRDGALVNAAKPTQRVFVVIRSKLP
jgi:hypothetical protein